VRILLVQPNVSVEEKRYKSGRTRIAVYQRTMALTRNAIETMPDLIVWPEGALPITYDSQLLASKRKRTRSASIRERLTRGIHGFAKKLNVPFVFGSLRLQDGKKRNAAVYIDPRTTRPEIYDKHHLVFLAERLPFADVFPSIADYIPGAANHQPGTQNTVFWVKDTPWVPSMCSDALFPQYTSLSLTETNDSRAVLLNLTNDVWFGDTSEPTVHLMMQSPRAVENRTWLVRSTNSGITAVIDPNGIVRARTNPFESTTLTYDIPVVAHPPTPYQRYGEWPLIMLGMLLMAIIVRARHT